MKKLVLIVFILISSTVLFAQGRGHKYGHWKHKDHGRHGYYYVNHGYYHRYYGRPYYVRHRYYYEQPRYYRRYDPGRGVYVTVRL